MTIKANYANLVLITVIAPAVISWEIWGLTASITGPKISKV